MSNATYNPIQMVHAHQIGKYLIRLYLDPGLDVGFFIRISTETGWTSTSLVWNPDKGAMDVDHNIAMPQASQRAISYAKALGTGFALGIAFEIGRSWTRQD